MPPFLGSGSHEYNCEKYRFIVMERYGIDIWKLFLENGRKFPEHTVYKVAWQIVIKLLISFLVYIVSNIIYLI
jgi:vaccinia related kinase